MLIKSVNDLKEHLGRAINKATTDEFLLPYVRLAQDEFIIPAIGPELVAELDAQYNAPTPVLTEANRRLLALVQRALAFYAYGKYLPFSLGNDGDNGLQEQSTDKTQPVRMSILKQRMDESADNAANALEQVLVLLDTRRADYPTWTASPACQQSRDLLVYSATELTDHLPHIGGSYRLFLALRPYLRKAERNDLVPVMGPVLFDELKAALKANAMTTAQKALLRVAGLAASACAYRDALFYLNITQTAGGALRILSEFDGLTNQKAAEPRILAQAQSLANSEAAQALNGLKSFLETNKVDYPTYANSTKSGGRKPYDLPDNDQYTGIFRLR